MTKPSQVLSAILSKGAVPNAMLFTGQAGLGRYETALRFAMALNCEAAPGEPSPAPGPDLPEACGACPSCRKILAGNHPDVLSLSKDGAFIKIGQIRALLSTLALRPGEGAFRVVILRDAENLNREAANALLKALEEPPARTLFILTASRPADLLPTIVSRCRELLFLPEPEGELARRLTRTQGADPLEAFVAAGLSGGSFSRALALYQEDAAGRVERFSRRLAGLREHSGEAGLMAVLRMARDMAKDKEELALDLDILAFLLRREIRGEGEGLKLAPESLVALSSALFSCQQDLTRNVNPRLAVEALLLAFHRAGGTQT